MTKEDRERIFKSIASLVLAGVANDEVAKALSVDLEKLNKILKLDEYKIIQKEMSEERALRDVKFNDGWDEIEKKSLVVVARTLENSRDGEFALRAAMVANKARRRNGNKDGPVILGGTGMRANVGLSLTFINKIQNNGGQITRAPVVDNSIEVLPQQRIDCLLPAKVENLFNPKSEFKQRNADGDDFLEGIKFAK